jgi:hypothetical protein
MEEAQPDVYSIPGIALVLDSQEEDTLSLF